MTLPTVPEADDPLLPDVDRFAADHRLDEVASAIDREARFPIDEFRALGRVGLIGLHVETALGGRGLPVVRAAAVLHHLARRGGTAFAKLSLQGEFSSVLAEHGSPALLERYFRPLLRGDLLVGNQVTEPGAGSDVAQLATTVTRDGDALVLHGTKSEAAFATRADAALVYARDAEADDPARSISVVVVPQNGPGIERRRVGDLGERWMERGTVRYDGARVPLDHRIGEPGRALDYVKEELLRDRVLLGAIYLGVARASWDDTVIYAGERRAFGAPLAVRQGVAFPLVEDWARLDAAWLYVRSIAARLDAGETPIGPSALAKWLAYDAAITALDHAVQFHGGRGYSNELPHERRWREVRSGGIAHGPSEVLLEVAARRLWRDRPPGGGPRPGDARRPG